MTKRPQLAIALASVAIVLTAATVSRSDRWNFDFAQYRGPDRPEPKEEFRFVMVGDRNGGRVPGLMPQAFREINYLYPDFVISVGDLIDGPTTVPEKIPQFWKEFDDEVALLESPFVYVPGNHDVWNATSKGIYEARYGPTYRSFDYRGLHFITLDTEQMDAAGKKTDRIDGEQLEWLKEDIARNKHAKAILVLMHKPVWLTGGLAKAEEVWKGLPVYVFAGHVHRYSYQVIDDIPHIILGAVAGGMNESGDAIGRFRHYMLVTVRDGKLSFGLIRLGGVLPPEVVLEEELPEIRLLADSVALLAEEDGAAGSARLLARNPLRTPVKFQLHKTSYGSGKPASTPIFPATELLAGGEAFEQALDAATLAGPAEFKAMLEFTNSQGQLQKMDFPVEPRRRRVAGAQRRAAAPTIDGDLSDWSNAEWQSISEPGQVVTANSSWKGRDDLSAQYAVATDGQNIYVAVRVTDDTVAYNLQMLDCDGIELYAASPGKAGISFSRDADWHRLVVAPFAPDGQAPGEPNGPARVVDYGSVKLAPLHTAYARHAKGYAIELALSKQALGWGDGRDANAQFDIAINDRDLGTRRESQLVWSGTDRSAIASRYYGRIVLGAP